MFKFKFRDVDMLHGSVADKFLLFALPLAFTGVFEQLFNTADTMVLGQFVGKNAMAAVGNNAPAISLMVMLFLGLSLGANVVIAQHIGARDHAGAKKAVHTALLLAIVVGVLLTIVGELFSNRILLLLAVPEEVMGMARDYLQIYFLGLPALAVYNFESAIFRSSGDSRTPLYSLIAASGLNIMFNLLSVLVFDFGVAGVAAATVVSNFVNAGILWWSLRRRTTFIHLDYELLRWDTAELKAILRVGIPAGVQGMVFCLSNLLVQSAINSLGTDVMAASAAAFAIEINVYCFLSAIGQATTTFIGQNYGARNIERCFRITRIALMTEVIVMLVLGGITMCFSVPLLHLFTEGATVVQLGIVRLEYVTLLQCINGVTEILSGTLRGYGYSTPPAVIALCTICGTRGFWVYTVFTSFPSFDMLMLSYPASWLLTGILLMGAYRFYHNSLIGRFVTA